MTKSSPYLALSDVTLDLPVELGRAKISNNNSVGGKIIRKGLGHAVRALDNVSLELTPGTRLAVVGHNGAGKTTLLRLAAGIYSPTKGKLTIRGKVTCLLTSTLGLAPAMSGRDNIRLACALYGLSRKETKRVQPEIEAFSELGDYLALPIGSYSAGMKTRLGMSIITALDPDILIIDEVFGAGDTAFSEKARKKLMDMFSKSRVLMFASHSESLLRQFCDTAILIENGQIKDRGDIDEVLLNYKMVVI